MAFICFIYLYVFTHMFNCYFITNVTLPDCRVPRSSLFRTAGRRLESSCVTFREVAQFRKFSSSSCSALTATKTQKKNCPPCRSDSGFIPSSLQPVRVTYDGNAGHFRYTHSQTKLQRPPRVVRLPWSAGQVERRDRPYKEAEWRLQVFAASCQVGGDKKKKERLTKLETKLVLYWRDAVWCLKRIANARRKHSSLSSYTVKTISVKTSKFHKT